MGLIILMVHLELFPYFVKSIFFTIWLEHVVKHYWAKYLKMVLRLMIYVNIIS